MVSTVPQPKSSLSLDEATSIFLDNLQVAIKERLVISVNNSPEVVLRLPCDKAVYTNLWGEGRKRIHTIGELTEIFGEGWNFRIINKQYDFAYVCPDGIWTSWAKPRPLVEFVMDDGVLTEQHTERASNMTMRFVRGYGAKREWEDKFGAGANDG